MALGSRTLVFVRHGQYDTADGGRLTALGREQAGVTGQFLAGARYDAIWASTLTRARETAEIIARAVSGPKVRHTGLLREGLFSKVEGYGVTRAERAEDRARADRAYARLVRKSRADRTELVICHGNLIRYLVCLAIDVPYARWTRMTSHHCALTRMFVRESGTIRLSSYNETGHLPAKLLT